MVADSVDGDAPGMPMSLLLESESEFTTFVANDTHTSLLLEHSETESRNIRTPRPDQESNKDHIFDYIFYGS